MFTESLSQGNSPRKQSLIPQPRGNSIAVRANNQKPNDRDRWARRSGRRVTRIPRSSSLKVPAKRAVVESTRATKPSIKTANKPMTTVAENKVNRSPTKIPIRHPSNGRFIQLSNAEKAEHKNANLIVPVISANMSPFPTIPVTDESVIMSDVTQKEFKPLKPEDDPGLIDLLKQSSAGSGTSSVVNATTTTAVQPLRIDTAKILPQDPDKNENKTEEKMMSNVPEVKINPIPQNNNANDKKPSDKDIKNLESSKSTKATVEPMNVEAVIENVRDDQRKETNEIKEDKAIKDNKAAKEELNKKEDKDDKKAKPTEEPVRSQAILNPTSSTMTNPIIEKHESNLTNRTDPSPQVKATDKIRNHGSETSLKSSNGLSTGSVESIRSTDTGVSLNTVRGVSSAREKRGTHIVKKSQEIETLSGNVMNLENQQNGEPT